MRRLSNCGFVARRGAFFFCVRMVSAVVEGDVVVVVIYIFVYILWW